MFCYLETHFNSISFFTVILTHAWSMQPASVIIMSAINKKKHVSTHWHDGKLTHYVKVLLKIIDVYKFHGHLGNVFSGNGHMEPPARETAVRTTSRWHVTHFKAELKC